MNIIVSRLYNRYKNVLYPAIQYETDSLNLKVASHPTDYQSVIQKRSLKDIQR